MVFNRHTAVLKWSFELEGFGEEAEDPMCSGFAATQRQYALRLRRAPRPKLSKIAGTQCIDVVIGSAEFSASCKSERE